MAITEENLIAARWKKAGNAWYFGFNRKHLTNYYGKWYLWTSKGPVEVKTMEEL